MADLNQKTEQRSKVYICALFVFVLFFLYSVIFGYSAQNPRLVAGALIFMAVLLFSYFSASNVFLALVFFIPYLIGADAYQINIGSFLQNFISVKDLYINPFSLSCLVILFFAGIELIKKRGLLFKIPLSFVLPASAILSLVIFLQSKYKMDGLVFELYLISGFAAYFLGYLFMGKKEKYLELLSIVVLSSIIPAVFAISQLLMGDYLYEGDSGLGRIRGTFPHSNTFGSYLFVVLTVAAVAFFSVKKKSAGNRKNIEKFLKFIPLAILFLFLILTYSRTAWIGFALSLLAIGLVRPYFRIPLVYLGSLAAALVLVFEKTRERIAGIFESHMFDSMYGRREIWDMALFAAKKSPIFGYGIGTFENTIRNVQGKESGNVYPHNDFIRFFLEGGILGIVLYFLYMLGAIYYSVKSYIRYPKGKEEIYFWGKNFSIDFKMLGMIPLLLFTIMIPISLVEAPSMDFVYQIFAWTILGSWLGACSQFKLKN
ncbi:MAG TPA: O-antigen ligase family protein [Candidatus Moranbacteria bacterium]|nr:O-antigen ligase family protein [Candidatus Moranbacteria bacterium]